MVSRVSRLLNVSAVGGEVKVFRVVLKVVLLEKAPQFLSRCKLDSTGTIDVHVPPAGLLPVLPLLQLPEPAVGQCVV